MNTKQIQPKQVWTANGEKSATILALVNFHDYHFDNGGGVVTYKLIGMEGDPQSAFEYFTGELAVPSEIVQQWGASDAIMWDFVGQSLNIIYI